MRNFLNTNQRWTQHAEDVANMSAAEIEQHTDHLDYCPDCKYVRCSCVRCHNSLKCNEICGYEVPAQKEMSS